MAPEFSERARAVAPFLAMDVMERGMAMEREGLRVYHLEVGEPDFAPPPAVAGACIDALERGETRYTDSRGLHELREAIARDYDARFGLSVDPECIIVTSGTSAALLLVFSLLVELGGEVILGTPHYPCYPNFVRVCGGEPVLVPTSPEDGYRLDPDKVAAAVTPRTRAIVVSSPGNPTGAVQSEETMRALAALGLPLVSDEIYHGLVYDDARVTCALAVSDDAYVLDGFSKRYAMTGYRLGWLVAPPHAGRVLTSLQQNLFISANRFVQYAGIAALENGAKNVATMRAEYEARRDRLVSGLRDIGFEVPTMPQGAFYVLADARRFGADSRLLAFDLLEKTRVGTTPGIDFGNASEGWLRFSYAVSREVLDTSLERLASALG